MSIINPGNSGRSNLNHLSELVGQDASAFRLTDGGKLESDGWMAFCSGVNRVFGFGKSDDDVVENKKTLEFVLGQIETGTSKSVRDALMTRTLKLAGDSDGAKYTVKDRLTRGTYVSSEMIRQLQCMATGMHEAEIANKATVDAFFGRPILGGDLDGPQSSAVGQSQTDQPCGFAQIVKHLQERGTEAYPKEQTAFWQNFGNFLLDGDKLSDKGKKYLADSGVLAKIERHVVNSSRAEKKIGAQDLQALTEKSVNSGLLHNAIARDLNLAYLTKLGEEGLADAVCDWLKATNDTSGITQNDCDWLSSELAEAAKSNRSLALPTEHSLTGMATSLFERLLPGEGRNPFKLLSEISEALQANAKKERLIPGSSHKVDNQESTTNQLVDIKNAMRPKVIGRMDVARLMGDSVKPILLARRQRINEIQTTNIEARSEKSKQLEINLAPFGALKQISAVWLSNRDSDPQYDRINRPTTASAFAREVLLRPILVAKHRQSQFDFDDAHETEKSKLESSIASRQGAVDLSGDKKKNSALSGDNKRQLNEYQMRQMQSMRSQVAQMEQGIAGLLDDTLPVLDRYSEFNRHLETCRLLPGGIRGLPNNDLEGLEMVAGRLLEDARNLDGVAQMLDRKYLDENNGELSTFEKRDRDDIIAGLRPPVIALSEAVDTITSKAQTVLRITGEVKKLAQLDEEMKGLAESMKELFAGLVSEPPVRETNEAQGPSTNPFDSSNSQVVSEPEVRDVETTPARSTNPFAEENLPESLKSASKSSVASSQTNVSPPQQGTAQSTNPFDPPQPRADYNPFK